MHVGFVTLNYYLCNMYMSLIIYFDSARIEILTRRIPGHEILMGATKEANLDAERFSKTS